MGFIPVPDIMNRIYNAVTKAIGVELKAGLPAGTNNIGDVDIASALPAGANKIGSVAIDQTTPGTTNKVVAEVTGSIIKDETDLAVTNATDFWVTAITATRTEKAVLMINVSASAVLSLLVDGKTGTYNGGTALDANEWYAFDVVMVSGATYNLQLASDATAQVKWIGGV